MEGNGECKGTDVGEPKGKGRKGWKRKEKEKNRSQNRSSLESVNSSSSPFNRGKLLPLGKDFGRPEDEQRQKKQQQEPPSFSTGFTPNITLTWSQSRKPTNPTR